MDDTPRYTPLQSGLYTTIALYAASNALSLAVFLILYHVSAVLADFRDPMLYAFLCSVALRGPKDWLVERLDWRLAREGSLLVGLLAAAAPPYLAAQLVWSEGKELARAFRAKVKEIREEYQRNMERGRRTAAAAAAQQSETSPRAGGAASPTQTPSSPQRPATAPPALVQPFALTIYAKAGLLTLTSRKYRKRRRKRGASAAPKRSPAPASNRLLLAVALVTLAWACFEWIRDSWSRTAHLALLWGAAATASIIVVRSIALQVAGWTQGTPAAAGATPAKTPASAPPSSPRGRAWTASPHGMKQPQFVESPRAAFPGDRVRSAAAQGISHAARALAVVETPVRALLRRNVHTLVTLGLITGLLVGTAGAATFLSLRIAGEARGVLVAARDAFPATWTGISAVTPLLDEELASEPGGSRPEQRSVAGGGPGRSLSQVASGVPLPAWLEGYRQDALELAQRSLPGAAAWLESRLHGFMRAHNLTDTLWDARLLYEAAQGPRACSEREKGKLLVALARTEVVARKAREDEEKAGKHAADAQRALSDAVAALDAAMNEQHARNAAAAAEDAFSGLCSAGGGPGAGPPPESCKEPSSSDTPSPAASPAASDSPDAATTTTAPSLAELQEAVVASDAVLSAAKQAHKAAAAALDDAERYRRVAAGRSQLCLTPAAAGDALLTPPGAADGAEGLVAGLGARLGSAYKKIFWQLRLREGLTEGYAAVAAAVASLTQRPGSAAAAADLSRLQRLAQAAAVPLFGLGRAAAASVGSTTAAAVMGSLGLFKLGLGVVHVGVQAALFLTLLYYLLAAKTDPLARAVALLPLPPPARVRAAAALNAALGGVFMSMLKLAAFHGLFAWVTFRIFGAPLAYTSAVASAAFALLPFVPTYSVALPGCAVVALQGRVASAAVLLVLHFTAYYIGDTVVLEDSGGHPFMMSLAILGGLWAFSNPLLGCLLGPTLLSLLSALGELHTELMSGSGSGGGFGAGTPVPLLFSPTAAAARRLSPVLTTPEGQGAGGGAAVPPATAPPAALGRRRPVSPRNFSREGSRVPSPRFSDVATREEEEEATVTAAVTAAVAEEAADGGDEVESRLRREDETSGDMDGFTFPRRTVAKESVRFDVGL